MSARGSYASDSHLEEFLYFESRVDPIPCRDSHDRLPPRKGDTGLFVVLSPGGSPGPPFWMGAQNADLNGDFHDVQSNEGREGLHSEPGVEALSLSKFQMTQGQ